MKLGFYIVEHIDFENFEVYIKQFIKTSLKKAEICCNSNICSFESDIYHFNSGADSEKSRILMRIKKKNLKNAAINYLKLM